MSATATRTAYLIELLQDGQWTAQVRIPDLAAATVQVALLAQSMRKAGYAVTDESFGGRWEPNSRNALYLWPGGGVRLVAVEVRDE